MSTDSTLKPEPRTVAFHEAGHAIAAVALQREFIRLSVAPVDGEPTGCKWSNTNVEDWVWIICSLAGPRAQIQFCEDSLLAEKLVLFQNSVLLPSDQWNVYSHTGWFSGKKGRPLDLDPVLSFLQKPSKDWPVPGLASVTFGELISEAEETLKTFFQRSNVAEAVGLVAEALLKTPVIVEQHLKELVQRIQKRLDKGDCIAILPPCVR